MKQLREILDVTAEYSLYDRKTNQEVKEELSTLNLNENIFKQ
jgi:hypothetical protein